MSKEMPRSIKKFIRRGKARIRKQFFDAKKQQELIKQLYENTRNK